MSIVKQKLLGFVVIIFLGIAFQGYKPVGSATKKHKTISEKKKLFKNVGCAYSDELLVEYPQFDQLKAEQSDMYRYDTDRYEAYAQKYARPVQEKQHASMYLKWISEVIGYGVFAENDIAKGDFIGEYSGVLREVKQAPDDLDYAWYYSLDGVDGKKLVVDGKNYGNELRFINHANNPNTVRIDVIGKDGNFHVVYIASKNIKKDEQLTVSYGREYFTSRGMKVVEV